MIKIRKFLFVIATVSVLTIVTTALALAQGPTGNTPGPGMGMMGGQGDPLAMQAVCLEDGRDAQLKIIAKVLDMDLDDLKDELTNGKSIKQIIKDKDLDWETYAKKIENKLYENQKDWIGDQVDDDKITETEGDKLLEILKKHHNAVLEAIDSGNMPQFMLPCDDWLGIRPQMAGPQGPPPSGTPGAQPPQGIPTQLPPRGLQN